MGRISGFPIDLRRRPYNTLALPCDCVIKTFSLLFLNKKCINFVYFVNDFGLNAKTL